MIEELTLALITLRTYARSSSLGDPVREAIEQLDKAGIFAALDEQAETAKAEGILAEVAVKSLSEAPFAQEQQTHVVEDDEDLTVSGRVIDVLRDAREIYTTPGKEQSEGWWDGAVDYVLTGEGRDESNSEK